MQIYANPKPPTQIQPVQPTTITKINTEQITLKLDHQNYNFTIQKNQITQKKNQCQTP